MSIKFLVLWGGYFGFGRGSANFIMGAEIFSERRVISGPN